jgi:hypothetical protein
MDIQALSNEELLNEIERHAVALTKNMTQEKWETLQDLKDEAEDRMDGAK